MPAILVLALLLIAAPAVAQEQIGHFKSNPNGTDSISTPSGSYDMPQGETADASKDGKEADSPFSMTGPQPEKPGPEAPSPASATQSFSVPLDSIAKPAGPVSAR